MVVLRSGATILPVNDLEAAVDRYRRLGFEVERYGKGGYAFCNRGNVWFHLSEGTVDPATSTTMVYLYVDDPEALYAEWQDVGRPPRRAGSQGVGRPGGRLRRPRRQPAPLWDHAGGLNRPGVSSLNPPAQTTPATQTRGVSAL